MRLLSRVSMFALAPLVGGACRAVGFKVGGDAVGVVSAFLAERLTDQSLRVADALRAAGDRAWRALEFALGGETVLGKLDRAEDKAFREQLRLFLLQAQFGGALDRDPGFTGVALMELRAARTAGLLDAGDADPAATAARLGDLTRFGDPAAQAKLQWELAADLSAELNAVGYSSLAAVVALRRPEGGADAPLLAVAVRYFFRRAVEDDAKLFQGLAFAQLDRLEKAQQDGTEALAAMLSRYAERLEDRLGELKDHTLTTRAELLELKAQLGVSGRSLSASEGVAPTPPNAWTSPVVAHAGGVAALALSPDGSRLATGGADGSLAVWDFESGRELHRPSGHRDGVFAVAFSADGKRVFSAGRDQAVRVWDAATGREVKALDRQTNRTLAVSADGRLAACGSAYDGKLRLFDPATGKELRRLPGHAGWVVAVAFAADGKQLLSAGEDRTLKLWDTATGKSLRTVPAAANAVAFLPDGWRLLSAGDDGFVRGWDPFTGRETFKLAGHAGAVHALAALPDGDAVSAGADGTVRVWSLRAKAERARFDGRAAAVSAVAVAPDGRIVSGDAGGVVRVWTVPG